MRWNEKEINEDKPLKDNEREIPLSKPGEDNWEQVVSSKKRPLLGGNYNA